MKKNRNLEVIQEKIRNEEGNFKQNTNSKTRFGSILRESARWGLITLLILEGLLSGIWTLLPTAILPWGASSSNYIGYVSHCSFAPISSLMLFGLTALGITMVIKRKQVTISAYIVMITGVIGMGIGLVNGISILTLMISGGSIAIGIVLGVVSGLINQKVKQ